MDVKEDENKIQIKAELPGLNEKDIEINLKDNYLTLKGEKKEEKEEKEEKSEKTYKKEISYGKFERTFSLPENIIPDKIKAEYKKGILNIEVEKDPGKEPKTKSIKVNIT